MNIFKIILWLFCISIINCSKMNTPVRSMYKVSSEYQRDPFMISLDKYNVTFYIKNNVAQNLCFTLFIKSNIDISSKIVALDSKNADYWYYICMDSNLVYLFRNDSTFIRKIPSSFFRLTYIQFPFDYLFMELFDYYLWQVNVVYLNDTIKMPEVPFINSID